MSSVVRRNLRIDREVQQGISTPEVGLSSHYALIGIGVLHVTNFPREPFKLFGNTALEPLGERNVSYFVSSEGMRAGKYRSGHLSLVHEFNLLRRAFDYSVS